MTQFKLGQYLQEVVGIHFRQNDLDALDILTGKTLGYIQFESQVFTDIYAHLTPFFYAIGHLHDDELGVHLHPHYVEREQLIVAHNDHGMVRDCCPSLAEYITHHLRWLEASCYDEEENPNENAELAEAIALANAAFGEGFYQIGRFGEFFSDNLEGPSIQPNTAVSMEAAAAEMLKYLGLGKTEIAATLCAKTIEAHRSTAAYLELGPFYQRCLPLLDSHPDCFKPEHCRELTLDRDDKQAYVEWFAELYQAGNQTWATKVLLDFCDVHCSYDHPIAHGLLVKLLGDRPTGRWVQQRQLNPAKDPGNYAPWEAVLAKL